MKQVLLIILVLFVSLSFSQEKQDKEELLASKKATNYIYEGNHLITEDDDFVSGEMAYRQAISKQSNAIAGIYNLGNAYYKKGNYEEALFRHEQAAKATTSKSEKHKAYHNIGNILMQNKKCKEAVEAFKNALRNDPTDDETRYNLGLAKICAEEQKDQEDENKDDKNKDENKDDQDKKENEDKKDKEGDDKEDKKDEGDQDKKEGEDEKDDEGKPKDEKEDKGKEGDDKKEQQKPKPQPGQMSPQQMKNLLEAMNNQEQKVQEKMNKAKEKGAKIKTEKDW